MFKKYTKYNTEIHIINATYSFSKYVLRYIYIYTYLSLVYLLLCTYLKRVMFQILASAIARTQTFEYCFLYVSLNVLHVKKTENLHKTIKYTREIKSIKFTEFVFG